MNPSELSDRELDAAVAEEVLGWVSDHDGGPVWLRYVEGVGAADTAWIGDFWPSTDPRAMMEVLEWARRTALYVEIAPAYEDRWVCEIAMDGDQDLYVVAHKLLPRAVAEAALLAVRAKKGGGDEKESAK